ncbi:relaxase/mobilization nuclease domain-containing protein [Colwellia hornerae]|uniref:MobA/VirD2-like nuclease domain-containing protein n=1 Tax=Colwellia hornerae TaxID=89402 RepID=A0A5C6QEN1_9GAMM|nr:relaxase/mobilization nuclease domain-containing protein [Colwellia hornerae]TWX52631.1 hypothetical protein ESZ28_11980 [Colwellia hornerae]TWX58394.1 hypothetical protein ESZ26_11945 [Colwellia hornerae]TWX67446.1 hypothetical protein ESZ27_09180 [Colwellia hornerae]
MIIEFIKHKKGCNRGRVKILIKYVCGEIKHIRETSNFEITKEKIDFVGSSTSLPVLNPLIAFENGQQIKLSGKEADLEPIINEFIEAESKNTRVKLPFEHIVISLQKGESLNLIQWDLLIRDLTEKLGLTDHHWISLRHNDTAHQHCHIICSTICNSPPHQRLVFGNNFKSSALIRNELEKKYNLNHDHNPYSDGPGKVINNAKYKTKKQSIRHAIDNILKDKEGKLSLPKFIEKLTNKGIGCFAQTRSDAVRGLSFTLGTFKVTGSKLGIGYSWKSLQERGIYYDSKEHQSSVEKSNNFEKKITNEIENFSLPRQPSKGSKNLLIKTIRLKVSSKSIRLSHYAEKGNSLWGLWIKIPLSFKGKTKEQIESDINFHKMLRTILSLYFRWLKVRSEEKNLAWERIKPFIKRFDPPSEIVEENTFTP